MFLQNKYTKWYFNIVNIALVRENINGYYEKHHIVPKSLGGLNTVDNIVNITARENFILHLLLVNMTTGDDKRKMTHAARNMCQKTKPGRNYKVSSRTYHRLRVEHSILASKTLKGRKKTQETRDKMKIAALNRTPEHRLKKSLAQIGRKMSTDTRNKISEAAKKRIKSPYFTTVGMHWWTNGSESKFCKNSPGINWQRGRIISKSKSNKENNNKNNF